jgi:hypothetical protein
MERQRRETPLGRGGVALKAAKRFRISKSARGHIVGMMRLETMFQQLYALGRQPDETTDAELISMARRFNYIPDLAAVEADYAVALRGAYARFHARQETGHDTAR